MLTCISGARMWVSSRKQAYALLYLCVCALAHLCFSCSATNTFKRGVTDIELPWKVLASSGNDRLVEFIIRPYFAVQGVHLAGSFNNWTWPGQTVPGAGRLYPMEYDPARDYWVCSVVLNAGAWEYIYIADDGYAFADEKNAITRGDGSQISRMVVK